MVWIDVCFFAYGYPVVPAPFVGKNILSPFNCLGT